MTVPMKSPLALITNGSLLGSPLVFIGNGSPQKEPAGPHREWQSLWGARWLLRGMAAPINALPAGNGSPYEQPIGPYGVRQLLLGTHWCS
jgi:hypothetical protein